MSIDYTEWKAGWKAAMRKAQDHVAEELRLLPSSQRSRSEYEETIREVLSDLNEWLEDRKEKHP
jgi:L-lactate utilization protein LutB